MLPQNYDEWFHQNIANQIGDINYEWNETGVDLAIIGDNNEVKIQQALDFFMSIEAPHLKEGTVRKMFDVFQYSDSTSAIFNMLIASENDWERVIGANGVKIYKGLRAKTESMPLYVLMGSVPFFGRGVGKRKFKKLLTGLQVKNIDEVMMINKAQICSVGGFEEKTASKIVNGMDEFYEFSKKLKGVVDTFCEEVSQGGSLDGQKICMTGFRDADMVAGIEAAGGEVQSGVSGKTTLLVCKDPTSNSGKVKKAKDKGVKVISINEMEGML